PLRTPDHVFSSSLSRSSYCSSSLSCPFFFNDTATTEIYTLSLPRRSSDLGNARGTRRSRVRLRCGAGRVQRAPADFLQSPAYTLDRKSTRLNCSHGSISYAVFCLKKKKKKKNKTHM